MAPREVVYFDLMYAHAKSCRLGKDFGIDHRAHAPDLHLIENCASEQFESTIDISNFDAQHKSHKNIPSQCVDTAVERILSLRAVTRDNVIIL